MRQWGGGNSGGGGGSSYMGDQSTQVPTSKRPFDTETDVGHGEQPARRDGQANPQDNFWDLKGEGRIWFRLK